MNAAQYLLCYVGIIVVIYGLMMALGCAAVVYKRGATRRVIRAGRGVIRATDSLLRDAEKLAGRLHLAESYILLIT